MSLALVSHLGDAGVTDTHVLGQRIRDARVNDTGVPRFVGGGGLHGHLDSERAALTIDQGEHLDFLVIAPGIPGGKDQAD